MSIVLCQVIELLMYSYTLSMPWCKSKNSHRLWHMTPTEMWHSRNAVKNPFYDTWWLSWIVAIYMAYQALAEPRNCCATDKVFWSSEQWCNLNFDLVMRSQWLALNWFVALVNSGGWVAKKSRQEEFWGCWWCCDCPACHSSISAILCMMTFCKTNRCTRLIGGVGGEGGGTYGRNAPRWRIDDSGTSSYTPLPEWVHTICQKVVHTIKKM
jgi:hypothetical protein